MIRIHSYFSDKHTRRDECLSGLKGTSHASPFCELACHALAGGAGTVKAIQVVRALAKPLERARSMKMEHPATQTSRRTDKTIGCGGRFQFKLMAALHTRGVSFLRICFAKALAVSAARGFYI